jgi:hypothetical protein
MHRFFGSIHAALLAAGARPPGRMAASAGPGFVFTAAGDYGAGPEAAATLQGIGAAGAALHLALGDLSYGDLTPEADWCAFVAARVGAAFPFELVAGNHDASAQQHIDNLAACLPHRLGPLAGGYG